MAVINNDKSNKLLKGTSGNDIIRNGGYWDGGYIRSRGYNVTINGGAGNDCIVGGDTPYGGAGNDTILSQCDSALINGDSGNDYIDVWGDNITINGDKGNDSIKVSGSNSMIFGGEGNDTISEGNNSTINGDKGDDYIRGGLNSTILGGEGNDTIWGDSSSIINGGYGNDLIKTMAEDVTINAGVGNDSIDGSYAIRKFLKYANGDGNDLIKGIRSSDTIQIATNSGYTSQKSGNDLIIRVGDGKMTFKNAADVSFTIETEPLQMTSSELKTISTNMLENFIAIGEGTDKKPLDKTNKLADKVSKSGIAVVRLMGKIFNFMTKYELEEQGNPKLDSNGNKIEDKSTSKKIINAGYNSLLNVDAMLTSAKKNRRRKFER